MIFRNFITILLIASTLTGCVSAKVYKDLEEKNQGLKDTNNRLSKELDEALSQKNKFKNQAQDYKESLDKAIRERDDLSRKYTSTKNTLEDLEASYDALEANSTAQLSTNAQKNRELLTELEEKRNKLSVERARLEALQNDLRERSARVEELESRIAEKDAAMRQLKEAVSKALVDFEGNGLTVEQRDGKVYVSLENKLLFESGSWNVGTRGREAVNQLASVLAQNPDIAVLIEGHTDNVPYSSRGQIEDNWDLSTKRATAIVDILVQNSAIEPKNLTAAGRGEYAPLDSNDSPEGRAKNRRIEVILTPKLDEVTKLLNEI